MAALSTGDALSEVRVRVRVRAGARVGVRVRFRVRVRVRVRAGVRVRVRIRVSAPHADVPSGSRAHPLGRVQAHPGRPG